MLRPFLICVLCAVAGLGFAISRRGTVDERARSLPEDHTPEGVVVEKATLGAGCFWCVEAVFRELKGVHSVVSGYSGGDGETTYEMVCSGASGHVEVVQITYDPQVISFEDLLEVFWRTHDPTTLNRQGNDRGPQYRSVVFYHDDTQQQLAEKYKTRLDESGAWDDPIVTAIEPFKTFQAAESYHQDYYVNNSTAPYCAALIRPKLDKFREAFASKLK